MRQGHLDLNKYIITKQLTKAPQEYSDFKSLPHVAVAVRQKAGGKSEADLVNNFIPYVICFKTNLKDQERQQEEKAGGLASKAYHPDELLASKGQISIDVDWYILQQVFPPITRLIEHIDGINMDFIAQCFGVDAKKYNYNSLNTAEEQE